MIFVVNNEGFMHQRQQQQQNQERQRRQQQERERQRRQQQERERQRRQQQERERQRRQQQERERQRRQQQDTKRRGSQQGWRDQNNRDVPSWAKDFHRDDVSRPRSESTTGEEHQHGANDHEESPAGSSSNHGNDASKPPQTRVWRNNPSRRKKVI